MEDNIKIDYDNINVEDIMRQIRENIRSRNYSPEDLNILDKDINTSFSDGELSLSELEQNVSLNNMRWNIQKSSNLRSNRKIIGPLIVLGKRVIRKISYWYIQFLFDQQIEFNSSVTNSLNAIEKYIKKLIPSMKEMSETVKLLEENREGLKKRIDYIEEDKIKLIRSIEQLEEDKVKFIEKIERQEENSLGFYEKIEHLDQTITTLKEMTEVVDCVSSNIENIESITRRLKYFEEESTKQYNILISKLEENNRTEAVTATRLRRIEHNFSLGNNNVLNLPITEGKSPDSIDMDYFLFEAKYRGSRAEIKERQRVYLEYFRDRKHVLDIGCGKGEFVELLGENNVGVLGIDINIDNVNYCTDMGLSIKYAEAIEYLTSCENSSLDGIFMAQVAEHLKPNQLITLIKLAREKLQTGSNFIVETINPQSLIVFTESYYMDPSHIKMVHPLTIKFIFETEGFSNIDFKFLSPVSDEQRIPKLECVEGCKNIDSFNNSISRLNDLIYGCRDYAIIAKR